MAKKVQESNNVTVTNSKTHRRANIAVIIVVSIAAFILIAIAVLCSVKVNPTRDISEPIRYEFYDRGKTEREGMDQTRQSKIKAALGDMKFSVMNGILQGHWDFSYNFKRNAAKEKIELSASDVKAVASDADKFMIEFVYNPVKIGADGNIDYSTAQSIKVDGETVYFDRLKVLIGNTDGRVGEIELYPYIDARIDRTQTDNENLSSETYFVTGINVRADTTKAYAALVQFAESLTLNI
ncbi:MAG: hypothetical protein J1G04_03240 [Clostridiales bacterium]|nr:hypothetical protein [Clostridiales bacterium]